MDREVVVFGWYGHGNAGDECFKDCFRALWPAVNFTFVDVVPKDVNDYDAFWVGGGSFLDQHIRGIETVTIPIGFVGVGSGNVHPKNLPALASAKVVIVRDNGSMPRDVLRGQDLAFCLPAVPAAAGGAWTILPNSFVVPKRGAPHWVHSAFDWFRWEFSSALADLDIPVNFVSMQNGRGIDDQTASELLGDGLKNVSYHNLDYSGIRDMISKSSLVISQRFHGVVFSALAGKRCVAISHHDKIKMICEETGCANLNYYGFSKNDFFRTIGESSSVGRSRQTAEYVDGARRRWEELSVITEKTFFS